MKKRNLAGAMLAAATLAVPAVVPAATAQASVTCTYSTASNGYEYAGHYSGLTAVPSATQDTSSGEEAQCLLVYAGYNPGGVDGVFGKNSQAAMKLFQAHMNADFGAGLKVDGFPGPQSWPRLRWYAGLF